MRTARQHTQRVNPQPKDLLRMIEAAPARELPNILVAVIKCCIRKGVYANQNFTGIVTAIESRLRTGLKSKIVETKK